MAYDGEVKNCLTPPPPLEVLPEHIVQEARKLLTDPDHWLRGEFAKDAYYLPVDPSYESAVAFCLVGAVQRAASNLGVRGSNKEARAFREVAAVIADRIDYACVPELGSDELLELIWEWNDGGAEHAEVLQVLDKCFTRS